jgi:hypothetical protein
MMNLKMILGGTKMKVKNGTAGRYLRFCEICGSFVGNMTKTEWEHEGRMCRKCAEAYASSLDIDINRLDDRRYSWELAQERSRASRLS